MELNINPETVCLLITRAHEFHAKEQVTITENPTSPADDWAMQTLADHADDATYQEMVNLINDLDPDQLLELVALMWLGRGDFALEEWQEALAQAADSHTSHTASYLIGTPLVADYWQEGLELHGYTCD